MRTLKKLTITLALLIMAVGGAWAQSSLNVVELEDVPADWATDESPVTAGDLPGFNASTLAEAQAWTGAPAEGGAMLIYAFDGNVASYVPFFNGEADDGINYTIYKDAILGVKSGIKIYYTAEPTEWSLTPDETGKNWTLAKMPASNIELQVEYYAESNLFLSKNALADKANIAVTAGELGVQFGNDGKSANTITEGTPMTVTYNGTKKVIGFKVAKAAAPVYTLLSAATTSDYGKVVCAAGHLHDAKTAVPAGCTAVGILGKVTETGHGLILALKDAPQQTWNTIDGWTSASYAGTTLKVLPDDAARGTNLTSYTTLGATTVSNWALGGEPDYDAIFKNLGGAKDDWDMYVLDSNVNAYITTGVGGSALDGEYWTAWTAEELLENDAVMFYINNWSADRRNKSKKIRPVLGF